ncbi:MAG: RNA polymerase sigma factor RpoH [Burkholderiales bacterium]|nr:RNA polymerase sigma factor RpoH [Burkholderiales bacterium]
MTSALSALNFPLPSATGSLESYIRAVSHFPLLTQEQETTYARRLKHHGDLDAARQLILSHLRVVVAIARGYTGYGLPQADLIQEGSVGLMKAVRSFDPERGVRLVSFAVHWIRAEIHEFVLRNWRIVKIATTKAQRKLFFNLRSLKKDLGPLDPTATSEMALRLGVKPEDVTEMETRLGGQDIALEPLHEDGEESLSPIAYLSDADAEPARIFEAEQTGRARSIDLENALVSLDPRSKRIIEARWLREKDHATLHQLSTELGVSAERVRQIEQKALKKMKSLMLST